MNSEFAPAESSVDLLVAKDAIRDTVLRYVQAVDRMDWDAVRACFHEDAIDNHGDYAGDVDGLLEWLKMRHAQIRWSMHLVSNVLIDVDGDDARSESYYVAEQRMAGAASGDSILLAHSDQAAPGELHLTIHARYVDHFHRRSGLWRIQNRTAVVESIRRSRVSDDLPVPEGWPVAARGRRDPLYRDWP